MPTVLVIDDEYAIRVYYERLLKKLGFSVISFKHGLEALQFFHDRPDPFDLAIIDWIMPFMDGSEIKKHLEQQYPGMPIIVASGSVDPSEIKLNNKQVFLLKPFSADEFIKTVNKLLNANYSIGNPS